MQTRSQEYSKKVFEQISNLDLGDKGSKDSKIYGSLCHNFPLMVLRSGLSQAVAFVLIKAKLTESKPSKPHKVFLENIADLTELDLNTGEKAQAFQQKIISLDLIQYQRITRKILAASIWYKRFAESWLGVNLGDEEQKEG